MKNEELIDEMQEKINNLYINKFRDYKQNLGLSVPHIPRISKNYLKNKTIIIGQETNTWYRKTNNDLKNVFLKHQNEISKVCLIDRFDHFIENHVANYPGKFWEFNKTLYDRNILKGKMISDKRLSHCWLNLFAVEACKDKDDDKGRPTKNKTLSKEIIKLQKKLLNEILFVLKPHLIISLTGHSLDPFLIENVLSTNCEIKEIDNRKILRKEMLAELVVSDKNSFLYNTKIIRCYHPSYFLGRINGNIELKEKLKKIKYKETVSDYYKNKLFEALNDFSDK